MNVTEPLSKYSKSHINSVTRFIEICGEAKLRMNVSLPKDSSSTSIYAQGHGLIDKLECISDEGVGLERLIRFCRSNDFEYKGVRLTDKKLYFEVKSYGRKVHFFWGHEDNQTLRKFFFNPSHFSTAQNSIDHIKFIIGKRAFNSSRILRMDLTVDIPISFEEVLGGLIIKFKRANSEFAKSSKRSGLKMGVNEDQIKIYDKAAKEKLDQDLTRIERQLKGQKLPFRKLSEFSDGIQKLLEIKPFETIITNHIHFFDGECKTEEQRDRYQKLNTLVEYEGIQLAQKKLSVNGNFKRDYGKFFMLRAYEIQPKQHFEKDMKTFFKEER